MRVRIRVRGARRAVDRQPAELEAESARRALDGEVRVAGEDLEHLGLAEVCLGCLRLRGEDSLEREVDGARAW